MDSSDMPFNGKAASDYGSSISDSHEDRIQRLETVTQETSTRVAEYGVKIDMLGNVLSSKLEAISERLGEKIDHSTQKLEELSPLKGKVEELEKTEAKRAERVSILKKGAIGIIFAGVGALAKTAAPLIWSLFVR